MLKRLRHPINSIREPFGTAGLIVACVALVAALGGTAFAATKLNSTQKKEVEKIAKKVAGKPGAPGAPGTNGTNGSPGAKGDPGVPGANGTNGKSVALGAAGSHCSNGGLGGTSVEVEGSGSPQYVCNGKNGTTGFTKTLPPGETEKGTWGTRGAPVSGGGFPFAGLFAPIAFVIPLATAPAPQVIGIEEGEGEAHQSAAIPGQCTGTVANPGAKNGQLCIFVQSAPYLTFNLRPSIPGPALVYDPGSASGGAANPAGATVFALAENEAEPMSVAGTWAVTAE